MYWLCLALIFYASGVRGVDYRMDWSPAGVAAVNHTFSVSLGDRLILKCLPRSYSNLIRVENEHQLEECNSTGSTKVELRGYCYGQEHPTLLYVNIEQSSAKLPSDFTFVEGATSYLTSFANAQLPQLAGNLLTLAGGECVDGLRLAVHVRDSKITTTGVPLTTSTDTSSSASNTSPTSPATQETTSTRQTLQPTLANPSALGVISGSRAILRHTLQSQLVSTLSILLSTLVLRAFS